MVAKEQRIILCDTYENYIGRTIRNGRIRLGLNVNDVCYGICSVAVYSKIECGEYAGGIHVLRALCERIGINKDRCGTYLAQAEYDEMMDRLYILEDIRDGMTDRAQERLACYEKMYKDIPLNRQYVSFMRGRLAELKGSDAEALEYYENAIHQTMPGYEKRERISCMTIYEAYMMFGVARIKRKLGDEAEAYKLYKLLLMYCMGSKVEKWNLVCIYPKTICEMTDIIGIDKVGIRGVNDMLEHCEKALNMLVDTSRLYYIRPILRNIISFKCRLGNNDDDIKDYKELLAAIEKLFHKYGHERELFEWYPYYVDCGFYCVNELIAERRNMRGMSIEELAGNIQSSRNVQRIVMGQVSPSYNTSKELLDRLGLKGVLRSDLIVGRGIAAYDTLDKIFDYIAMRKFEDAERLISQLRTMLYSNVEINNIVLEYLEIWLQMLKGETKASEAVQKLERLLPFKYSEIGKYKYFIKHERMILMVYIDCLCKMEKYEAIPDYDKMTLWITDELSKKQFASAVESLDMRYANWYGNAGRYKESDKIAEEGIGIEVECERMHCLNTLLYCRAWNDGERGNVSESDKELCRCAYEIAKLKKQNARMELYCKWLEKQ
jgi:transcriptional regulator with XRE-family HTH domain